MNKLELEIDNKLGDDNSVYTYNILFKEIQDDKSFDEFISKYLLKSDLSMINLDKYKEYLDEIIDDADYIFIVGTTKKEEKYYKNRLKQIYYDEIIIKYGNPQIIKNPNYIFEIKDKDSKQIIKDTLKFNLSDEYREPVIVKTDKKYILNDDKFDELTQDSYSGYYFIKNNNLLLILYQYDGYIYDYRDKKVRDRQIKKYLNK